ncbi:MAG: hypothetical protein ACXVCE_01640 [Bacteriovorax sp.]
MNRKILLASVLCLSFSRMSFADTALSYPELDVTPRATERLNMLIEKERESHFFSQLPMQTSAISTLATGLLQLGSVNESKDPSKKSPNAGIIVGAAWLGINYYVGQRYHVYEETMTDVNKIPGKTARDQLMRERIAEEGINRAARLANRLKWISAATNAGANVYMLSKVKKETAAHYMGAFSLLASFAPVLFTSESERVAEDQNAYKKKVYGPLFTTSVFETGKGKYSPGFLLSSTF